MGDLYAAEDILEARLRVARELPWPLPASLLMQMTDEDLDALASATHEGYWPTLNAIVTRISDDPSFASIVRRG